MGQRPVYPWAGQGVEEWTAINSQYQGYETYHYINSIINWINSKLPRLYRVVVVVVRVAVVITEIF